MGECYRQLTRADRLKLEELLRKYRDKKYKIKRIAEELHVHRSTIYNELKRGEYEHLNSDYTTEMRYSPDIAQRKYEENLKVRGTQLKINNDIELANYIEDKILNDNYSPEAVIGQMKVTGKDKEFSVTICVRTLYNYIDKDIFYHLTNKSLPVKGKRKRKYNHVRKEQARASAGESIEHRPPEVDTRENFGDWEMDTVIGQKGVSQNSLLVLTERKTRMELVFKLNEHTASCVTEALNRLEKKWGTEKFRLIFHTITVDNGTEFSFCEAMEQSCIDPGQKRTKMYYCHPYSSWERGTNEVTNKLIRRHIPKGTDFDDKTDEEIQRIEDWINDYPRRLHGYRSARDMYYAELKSLGLVG